MFLHMSIHMPSTFWKDHPTVNRMRYAPSPFTHMCTAPFHDMQTRDGNKITQQQIWCIHGEQTFRKHVLYAVPYNKSMLRVYS